MSVWMDMYERSIGEIVRKEDFITEKELLSDGLNEELDKGTQDLAGILMGIRKRLSLSGDETLFDIEDKDKLLSDEQILLLQASLILPFNLGKYKNLEKLLTEQKVHVIIDPSEPMNKDVREVPSELEIAEEFWEEKVRKNPNDEFARRMLGEIKEEIAKWRNTLIRGLYSPTKKVIYLFPNNMKKEYGGTRMNELLVSTLVHEAMHAYFDRIPLNELPYVYSLEEPMAEFGMLLYLKETSQNSYYEWAKDDVASKKSCYRYGAALMDQCEREGTPSQTRRDLESYKMVLPTKTSKVTVSSVSASMATSSGRANRLYQINGKGVYSMPEVIEEYIKYKLNAGTPFIQIQRDVHSMPHVGRMFISTTAPGVSIHKGQKPYSFNYKGTVYYITTQLKDKTANHNFLNFRTTVSMIDAGFIITPI